MENKFWDERYSEQHYVYGKEPNGFFKQWIDKLQPGKLLLPGEGEGRNAVYAAKKGWDVTAIDFSEQAKIKAIKLAEENNVTINYIVSSTADYKYPEQEYDAAALVFVHFAQGLRENVHRSIIKSLKTGGTLIIEAFSKAQIHNSSGGPKDLNALYSIDDFRNDFCGLNISELSEYHIELKEGDYHKGPADVIRFAAIKTNI
ncbi:MAG: class I SAM-dependent methyltransferase [Ignavibacteria bacterium]